MTQINEIKIMNDTMILYLKKLGMNYRRNEIISKILEDESCFFKMDKEDAYIILKDIGIQNENIDNVYSKLISYDLYFDLYKNGKINENDNSIIIKYKIYDNNLFKKNNVMNKNVKNNLQMVEYKENIFIRFLNKIKVIFRKK